MIQQEDGPDDLLTAAMIGALAFVSTMLIHEGLGHVCVFAIMGARWYCILYRC